MQRFLESNQIDYGKSISFVINDRIILISGWAAFPGSPETLSLIVFERLFPGQF